MRSMSMTEKALILTTVLLTGVSLYHFGAREEKITANSDTINTQAYQRPATAPNGNAWPLATGYIEGFKRLNRLGRSTLQVENYQSGHDFYVKLVHSTKNKHLSVRHAFVKRFESFKFAKVTPGKYYLLYKNLGTGESTKSDVFSVEEKRMHNGVKYSDMRISMYHVQDGNFEGHFISDAEFASTDSAPERRKPSDS